jgi:hypothetical protein
MKTKRNRRIFIPVIIPMIIIVSMIIAGGSCKNKSGQNTGDVSQEDVEEEFEEAVDTAAAFLTQEREALMETYQSKIESAENQIQEIKDQFESKKATVRQDYQVKVQMLESQVAYIKKNIGELKGSTEAAWKEISVGVDTALVDLNKAIQDAKEEFKSS